jgi:hypothetical protein
VAFLEGQMTDKTDWLRLETDRGSWLVAVDDLEISDAEALDCLENENEKAIAYLLRFTDGGTLNEVEHVVGYGVRLSAPGYLDCTEWDVYTTKREARKALRELERGE